MDEALLFYEKSIKNNPLNYYVKKRLFDIEYSLTIDKNKNTKLFNDYINLLNIFINHKDLNRKFENIAIKLNKTNYIKYFSIKEY